MTERQPQPAETLIHARWVLPIRPARTVLNDHAVVTNQGRIVDLLPSSEANLRYSAKQQFRLDNHILMPGLINLHGHGAMSLFRGYADDKALHDWLENYIWPAEARWVDADFVEDGSLLAITEMLRSGTTTFSDMYFFPEMTARAAELAGIRSQLAFPIFDFPTAWGQGPDDYIHKGLKLRDDLKYNHRIEIAFGPHAPYTVGDDALRQVATLAAELDAAVQIHLHETQQEVDQAVAENGQRPIARLNELGLLTPRTQCVHMTALDHEDIAIIKQAGSHIVHCPRSNLKLASGFCPTAQLLAEGINVAIGTDGAASNNSLNLFAELGTAALLAKAVSGNAAALNDWQALEMATINGARALAMEHLIGSLEAGKQADIIAIDLSAIEQQPLYHPASQLVYTDCGSQVSHSWVDGELVLKDRKPTRYDLEQIRQKATLWRQKIADHSTTR